VNIYRYFIF